jgi:NADH dehydrogenase/NADH:ubiquinone oxidoreductase subunit G
MVAITINGRKVEAKDNSTVLENVRNQGITLPTLCYHDEVSPFGACRLCTVEVKTNGKWQLATACNTPVVKGLEVRTDSEAAKEARALAARLLYTKFSGAKAVREIADRLGVDVAESAEEANPCILCGLCVRACREVVGACALTFADRGLGRDLEEPKIEFSTDACIGCGSCAFICPTGYVRMETTGDRRMIWDKVFKMATCSVCGRYFAPEDQLAFISRQTGVPLSALKVCVSCR